MNTAILKLSDEFINDMGGFLPYVLQSNDINFVGVKVLHKFQKHDLKVSSSTHFGQGFGLYSLHFELGKDGFMFLKDVKLVELL